MKKKPVITEAALREMLSDESQWEFWRDMNKELITRDETLPVYIHDEEESYWEPSYIDIECYCGTAWVISEHKKTGLEITFDETFNCDRYNFDSLDNGNEGRDAGYIWGFNFDVISDDGDLLLNYEIGDIVAEFYGEYTLCDYSELNEDNAVEEIDMDANNKDVEIIEVDNQPNLKFSGKLIAQATSHSTDNDQRWTELELWKTSGGKYICRQIGKSLWNGEDTRYSAKVCETIDEVKTYFGYGWLAKDLYYDAEIDCSVEVK